MNDLETAVRRFVAAEGHLLNCRCYLCEALAKIDAAYDPAPFGDPELAPYWNRHIRQETR